MTGIEIAALAVALFVLVTVGFQLGLALGAPWGRAAYGGSHPGVLPRRLRFASAAAVVVWPLLGLVVLRRAGLHVWAPVTDAALPTATWVLVGVLALGTVLNTLTPSRLERSIWAPSCLAALVATTTVALLAD